MWFTAETCSRVRKYESQDVSSCLGQPSHWTRSCASEFNDRHLRFPEFVPQTLPLPFVHSKMNTLSSYCGQSERLLYLEYIMGRSLKRHLENTSVHKPRIIDESIALIL